jgi:Uma2 family endonuclease
MAVMLRRYRFTVDEYERLAQAQLLTQCDRIELLDGEIVEMTPIGDRHASVVARLTNLFSRHLGNRSIVWAQNPIQLRVVRSMPQPDVVLVRPRADFYAAGKPGPDDVLLLIQVMDSSAETDRDVKLPLYARAGIAEAWLLDLATDRVEAFRQPTLTGYREAETFARNERLAPQAFPDFSLTVADLLG